MKTRRPLCFALFRTTFLGATFFAAASAGSSAFAASDGAPASTPAPAPKTYSVTGDVVAVGARTVTIKRDDTTYEIARDAVSGSVPLAVGMRVTVHYALVATSIEARPIPSTKNTPSPVPSSTEKADRAAQKAAERAERASR